MAAIRRKEVNPSDRAAILARRDAVRSRQTAPIVEPKPELFRPERAVTVPLPQTEAAAATPKEPEEQLTPKDTSASEPLPTTTSRLLEAMRRAQKRKS